MTGAPMNQADRELFFRLLQRWCTSELDQFEHLTIPTRWGEVYASFSRELPPDHPAEMFRPIPADPE
ncbi:hypothetical protein ACFVMC_13905 [Nocardia sp. NPDC127579]|uniref:hypothetical protein n=1 Tax=Nocardia sp. NPDC127579 TaxID=3345402 RepID=UPI003642E777